MFKFGNVEVDATGQAYIGQTSTSLSEKQRFIVKALASTGGKPVSIATLEALLTLACGKRVSDTLVKVHVHNARKKIAALNGNSHYIESLEGAYVMRESGDYKAGNEKRPRFSNDKNEALILLTDGLSAIVNTPRIVSYADTRAVELAAAGLKLAAQWCKDTRELTRAPLVREIGRLQDRLDANPVSPINSALVAFASGLDSLTACRYNAAKKLARMVAQHVA